MKDLNPRSGLRHFCATARLFASILLPTLSVTALAQTSAYVQTNIVSDGSVTAQQTD
jgi:hypothetical protein